MASEIVHLCNLGEKDTGRLSKQYKKLVSGRHRNSDNFKCGSCQATFQTICVLQAHCERHSAGGSFYYDHFTRMAFPKYETACAFTQVNDELLNSNEFESSRLIIPTALKVKEEKESMDSNRKSKRIKKNNLIPVKEYSSELPKNLRHDSEDKYRKSKPSDDDKPDKTNEASIIKIAQTKSDGTVEIIVETKDISTDMEKIDNFGKKDNSFGDINTTGCTEVSDENRQYQNTSAKHGYANNSRDITDDEKQNLESPDFTKTDSSNYLKRSTKLHEDENMDIDVPRKKTKKGEDTMSKFVCGHKPGVQVQDRDSILADHENDEIAASKVLLSIRASKPVELSDSRSGGTETIRQSKRIKKLDKEESSNISESITPENEEVALVNSAIHKKQKSEKQTKRNSSDKNVECPTCGKVGTKGMLAYHKHLHAEKKSFSCDKCVAMFQHPRSLQIHMRQHSEREYKCDQCPAAFFRQQYLTTHMLKHSGENPYICDKCGKSYRDNMHLKRHIRHVHEGIRPFECDICHDKFYRTDHLKNHRLRHFEADKKCQYCDKLFKHQEDMARHVKTHTGEKKWYCHICNHGFVANIPYYMHMSKKHDIPREKAIILKKKLRELHKLNQPIASTDIDQDNVVHYRADQVARIKNELQQDFKQTNQSTQSPVIYTPSIVRKNSESIKIASKVQLSSNSYTCAGLPISMVSSADTASYIINLTQASSVSPLISNGAKIQQDSGLQNDTSIGYSSSKNVDFNNAAEILQRYELNEQSRTLKEKVGIPHKLDSSGVTTANFTAQLVHVGQNTIQLLHPLKDAEQEVATSFIQGSQIENQGQEVGLSLIQGSQMESQEQEVPSSFVQGLQITEDGIYLGGSTQNEDLIDNTGVVEIIEQGVMTLGCEETVVMDDGANVDNIVEIETQIM